MRASHGSAAEQTLTFTTPADTYVSAASPSTNFGRSTSLYVDGSPEVRSVIEFPVSGIGGGSVTQATLRVFALSNNKAVAAAAYTDTDWSETGLTFSTFEPPAVGPVLSTASPVTSGSWVSFDVTAAVTTDGLVAFTLVPTNSTNTRFASRESAAATSPQLIVTTSNAGAPPPPPPAPPPPPPPGGDPVIAAAGDIACDPSSVNFHGGVGSGNTCRQASTAAELGGVAAVLLLGDNQYYCGGLAAFMQSYDLSWGKYKAITHPSIGNHELLTSGGTGCDSSNLNGAGYFTYFGAAAGATGKGYYSFDVGAWHLIALNSNCSSAGGCGLSSPQGQWLAADLAAHRTTCTLAYWHIPLWSSGGRASPNVASIVQQLYAAGVDVILNGHDHIYERFAPQNASGQADPSAGIREFIVGTGGANHTSIASIARNSQVRNTDTFGVLKLTLHAQGYDWDFQPASFAGNGSFTDSGTASCH